jgi:hypothetical protein
MMILENLPRKERIINLWYGTIAAYNGTGTILYYQLLT